MHRSSQIRPNPFAGIQHAYTGFMPGESESIALAPHRVLREYYADATVKRDFLRKIFDGAARDYDLVEKLSSLGKGSAYRRQALVRAGLSAGMKMLDVGVGTGLVAREAIALVGDSKLVVGLDPARGWCATRPMRCISPPLSASPRIFRWLPIILNLSRWATHCVIWETYTMLLRNSSAS